MQNNPRNSRSADDADPWGALEADLFGNDSTEPAAPPQPAAPPAFAAEKPVTFERHPEPARAPASESPRGPAREEVRAAAPEDEEDDEFEDEEDEDDDEEADGDEEESEAEEAAPAAGKKADSYWDALADWNWDETESSSSGSSGGSRSGPPPRSQGQRPPRSGSSSGPSRNDRGDQGRGRDSGKGRGAPRSGGSPGGDRQERGPRSEPRSAPPSRPEQPVQQRSQSAPPPPPPSRPAPQAQPEEDWDDFGAGVIGGAAKPAGEVTPAEREQTRSSGTRGSEEGTELGSDGKRRRRRRGRGRRSDGPVTPAGQSGQPPRGGAPEYNEEGAEEPDLDFVEPVDTPAAASAAPPAPAGEERDSQGRPRGRRRRGGRGGRGGERSPDQRERGPAPRQAAPPAAARDDDFDSDVTVRPPASKPAYFESTAEVATGVDEEVELIDYGDMPTWEEAISYLLHPDQVEVDPTQQTAGAQRRAQAQEQGRSGSRHYGRKNPS